MAAIMKTAPLLIAATLACAFAARAADPVVLFDGSGLDAWKMDKEGAWIVKDGELQPAEKAAAATSGPGKSTRTSS